jgi:hypothetical protein
MIVKICWDNLENLHYVKKSGVWRYKTSYKYVDACTTCGEPFLANVSNVGIYCSQSCQPSNTLGKHRSKETKEKLRKAHTGKILSDEHRKKLSIAHTGKTLSEEHRKKISDREKKEKSHWWKGGVKEKNIPLFDTYAPKIFWCESVRRSLEDNNVLQVRCTYCGRWYTPKTSDICNRVNALDGKTRGENRLYCSNECKQLCPIYLKRKYSAEETNTKKMSREVQADLRQMVFERDNWCCIKCGNGSSLHCHHIEGIRWEPLESADIDKCVTLCKDCHKEVHSKKGCRTIDMRCFHGERYN